MQEEPMVDEVNWLILGECQTVFNDSTTNGKLDFYVLRFLNYGNSSDANQGKLGGLNADTSFQITIVYDSTRKTLHSFYGRYRYSVDSIIPFTLEISRNGHLIASKSFSFDKRLKKARLTHQTTNGLVNDIDIELTTLVDSLYIVPDASEIPGNVSSAIYSNWPDTRSLREWQGGFLMSKAGKYHLKFSELHSDVYNYYKKNLSDVEFSELLINVPIVDGVVTKSQFLEYEQLFNYPYIQSNPFQIKYSYYPNNDESYFIYFDINYIETYHK